MKRKILLIILMILSLPLYAQDMLTGVVKEKDEKGNLKPLIGANIIWQSTSRGTTTDINGAFELAMTKESNLLIVSFIGYKTEKITITDQRKSKLCSNPNRKS